LGKVVKNTKIKTFTLGLVENSVYRQLQIHWPISKFIVW